MKRKQETAGNSIRNRQKINLMQFASFNTLRTNTYLFLPPLRAYEAIERSYFHLSQIAGNDFSEIYFHLFSAAQRLWISAGETSCRFDKSAILSHFPIFASLFIKRQRAILLSHCSARPHRPANIDFAAKLLEIVCSHATLG